MANNITATAVLTDTGSAPHGKFVTGLEDPDDRINSQGVFKPVNDRLYLAVVTGDSKPGKISMQGSSIDWILDKSALSTAGRRISVFRGMKTSGNAVSDFLTVNFGGRKVKDLSLVVVELNFVDTSGTNGSGAVVQSVVDAVNPAGLGVQTADVAAMTAFGDSVLNAAFGVVVVETATEPAPPDGYDEVANVVTSAGLEIALHVGQDLRVLQTWDDTATYLYYAAEIKSGSAKKRIDVGQIVVDPEQAIKIRPRLVSGGDTPVDANTLAGLVKRTGEKLGLSYDQPGFERNLLHDLANEAVEEVLLETHCFIQIGDTITLTPGVAEYRLPPEVLAIDNGRGSTPSGIGAYEVITLDEMIQRQSAQSPATGFRKAIAVEGNLMIVHPTPDVNETLRFFYVPKPLRMQADTDDITGENFGGLPSWGRRAVEAYMLWQAAEYDDKANPLNPKDYHEQFVAECHKIRERLWRLRARTLPAARIGYPNSRGRSRRNDQYWSPGT